MFDSEYGGYSGEVDELMEDYRQSSLVIYLNDDKAFIVDSNAIADTTVTPALSPQKALEIIRKLTAFYEFYTPDDIDQFNEEWRKPADVPAVEGYIYLMESLDYYKIGISDDPGKRLSELRIGNPAGVRLVWFDKVTNPRDIEIYLHGYFRSRWVAGEWFDLSSDDIEYIKKYVKGFTE